MLSLQVPLDYVPHFDPPSLNASATSQSTWTPPQSPRNKTVPGSFRASRSNHLVSSSAHAWSSAQFTFELDSHTTLPEPGIPNTGPEPSFRQAMTGYYGDYHQPVTNVQHYELNTPASVAPHSAGYSNGQQLLNHHSSNSYSVVPSVCSRQPSRVASPIFQSSHGDGGRFQSRSKRGSENDLLPYLQLPLTISPTRGSLAEFAAQVTCLFWFESAQTLTIIEESQFPIAQISSTVPEATPSTGFLKWVTTILSTTQVTQNVILLALLFIYRLKKQFPTVKGKLGSEFRLLTVALMLGNKFLDDNTYTNKTWAEVSGISVSEVHVMEVEFLSHMKYNLYTSKQEWHQWHQKLSRFWSFFDSLARQSQDFSTKSYTLRPTLQIPQALPSPPASIGASPPYAPSASPGDVPLHSASKLTSQQLPAIYPAHQGPYSNQDFVMSQRKRSLDDNAQEPPPKRQSIYKPPTLTNPPQSMLNATMAQSLLPGMPATAPASLSTASHHHSAGPMALPHYGRLPTGAASTPQSALTPYTQALGAAGSSLQHALASIQLPHPPFSQPSSRQQTPFDQSPRNVSPSAPALASVAAHIGQSRNSPSYFLGQRSSPYRPVQGIRTLLVPPPSGQIQNLDQSITYDQMSWQPLGKQPNERRNGRVPYLHREAWPQTHQIDHWPSLYSVPTMQG